MEFAKYVEVPANIADGSSRSKRQSRNYAMSKRNSSAQAHVNVGRLGHVTWEDDVDAALTKVMAETLRRDLVAYDQIDRRPEEKAPASRFRRAREYRARRHYAT